MGGLIGSSPQPRARRGARAVGGWLLACALGLGVGGASVWVLLGGGAPQSAPRDEAPTTFRAQEGSLGRTASYTARATWRDAELGVLGASGVVTSHGVAPGDLVEPGSVLLGVDLRPVVVVPGDVPAFRDLDVGARGADVQQLETFLHQAGHLAVQPDDAYDRATARAVRAWQRALGVEPDGIVRAGDVVFSPALPARVWLAEDVTVGRRVEPGTPLGSARAGDPDLALRIEDGQRRVPEEGTSVVVVAGGSRWDAVTGVASADADGAVAVPLHGPDGAAACRDECDLIAGVQGEVLLTVEVTVVPEASGIVVPVAALRTDAAGTVSVTLTGGEQVVVEVLAGDGGRAVVSGLEAGTVVRLFGSGDVAGDQGAAAGSSGGSTP